MAHDAAFLAKCEQFLLHPTVRALTLAQRVDFLERKGLSPEEISACLQRVDRQHGLSRVLRPTASAGVAAASAASSATGAGAVARKATWWSLVVRYGVASAATLLLAYAYVRFREQTLQRALATHRAAIARTRQRRSDKVQHMVEAIQDQRSLYEQVLTRVKRRLSGLQTAASVATTEDEQALRLDKQREQELRGLRAEVATLKVTVLDEYTRSITRNVQLEEAKKRDAEQAKSIESGAEEGIPLHEEVSLSQPNEAVVCT